MTNALISKPKPSTVKAFAEQQFLCLQGHTPGLSVPLMPRLKQPGTRLVSISLTSKPQGHRSAGKPSCGAAGTVLLLPPPHVSEEMAGPAAGPEMEKQALLWKASSKPNQELCYLHQGGIQRWWWQHRNGAIPSGKGLKLTPGIFSHLSPPASGTCRDTQLSQTCGEATREGNHTPGQSWDQPLLLSGWEAAHLLQELWESTGQRNSCPAEPGATMATAEPMGREQHGMARGMRVAPGLSPGGVTLLWEAVVPVLWPQEREPVEEAMSCVWPWCPQRWPQEATAAATGGPQTTRQQLCHQLVGSSLWEGTVGPGAEGSPLLRERLVKRKEKPGRAVELLLQQKLRSQAATPSGSASFSTSTHGRQGHTAALGTWSTELLLGTGGTGNDVQDRPTCDRTTVQSGILGH